MTSSTVVYVSYGTDRLDLSWIPDDTTVVVVHNDDRLADSACAHDGVIHIRPDRNVGFGAGINLALPVVRTRRVILCNPDTRLDATHFAALDDADDETIVAVPLVEPNGVPNAIVNPYWNAPAFLATAWRLGRWAPRGGRRLRLVAPLLGRWGRAHGEALTLTPGEWPIAHRWLSAAVVSMPVDALRSVGGFDESYFLYFEDADLHQRLTRAMPDLRVRLADLPPGRHEVGGCARGRNEARVAARHRRRSARTYAARQPGVAWRLAEALLSVGPR